MEQIDIVAQIKNKLAEIEAAENVDIIMAVESGSRAWGFPSPDSDYDVRFIYVRKPYDYLRLDPLRDVIEWQLDDVYDVSGWDLQKALRLMHESNPSIHEWCTSPIVYMENELAEPLRELAAECFLPKKSIYHYLSMAEGNYNKLQSGDVKLKRYFYALRTVLAAKWVAEKGTVPPMLFDELVSAELDPEVRPAVEELLKAKRETSELGVGAPIQALNKYLQEQIEQLYDAAANAEIRRNEWDKLEKFFRKTVL